MIPQLAHDARENGATWHDIATALATEREQSAPTPRSPTAGGPTTTNPTGNHAK